MKCVIIEIANPGKKNLPILRVLVDLSRSKHSLHGDHQLLFLVLSYLDGFDLNANTRRCGFTPTIFVNRPSREKVVAGNEKYCKCTESLTVEFEKMPEYSIFRKLGDKNENIFGDLGGEQVQNAGNKGNLGARCSQTLTCPDSSLSNRHQMVADL